MVIDTSDALDKYYNVHTFSREIAGKTVEFKSKPGLPAWNQVPDAAILIARYLELKYQQRVLHLGCGNGALTAWLAASLPWAEVYYSDLLEPCHQMTRLTLGHNNLENTKVQAAIDLPEVLHGTIDLVMLLLPKGRELARRWLVQAWHALRPEGELYLAGANNEGIRSALKDCDELFGDQPVLGYKKGCRLARYIRGSPQNRLPDWAYQVGILPGTWIEVDIAFNDQAFRLHALPGIFSSDRLDEGTRLLLENADMSLAEQTLDLGCGSGIIGLAAAARGGRVDLVDANHYAVAASQENLKGCANTQVFAGDLIHPVADRRYNRILTNPPFHSGKDVDHVLARAFVAGAARLLLPKGEFWLVANRFLPYQETLNTYFPQVEVHMHTNKYILYRASKP